MTYTTAGAAGTGERGVSTVLPDWVEPVDVFSRLVESPGCILLESQSRTGAAGNTHSFIFAEPFGTLRTDADRSVLDIPGRRVEAESPFPLLREALASCSGSMPSGCAAGYLGYELHRFIEGGPVSSANDQAVPECLLWLYNCVIVFDHGCGEIRIDAYDSPSGASAEDCLERMLDLVNNAANTGGARPATGFSKVSSRVQSSFTKRDYCEAVRRAKEYIAAGDVYQVNLSQRFSTPATCDPWTLYLRLRRRNPAPYAAFVNAGDFQIVSSSPECFLDYDPEKRIVRTRPIKGTRPRGKTCAEDVRLADELLGSAKDNAENVMIVDLERNDLGRVCAFGSVCVPELVSLESHPTVHHLVSTVQGTLREGRDAVHLLEACFPGGSITGAPKIRAIEIIDELEPVRRDIYTGSIGRFGFDGSVNLNIAIRSVLIREGMCHFHAGGGIVADSDPEQEYAETLDKAQAFFEVLGCM